MIPAGAIPSVSTDCVTITAIDDELVEGDHEFNFNITSTNNTQVSYPEPINTVTIGDNDGTFYTALYYNVYTSFLYSILATGMVVVGLVYDSFNVTEGIDFFLEVCAWIDFDEGKQLGCDLSINFTATNGPRASKYVILTVYSYDYTSVHTSLFM